MPKQNNDIRCTNCGKKLAEAQIKDGFVSIICRCGVANLITAISEKKEIVQGREKMEYDGLPLIEGRTKNDKKELKSVEMGPPPRPIKINY